MVEERILIDGKQYLLYAEGEPEVLLVEPMDEQDLEFLDRELEILKAEAVRPFALAALVINDWNRELAPWPADPVFGKELFTGGAPATLRFIEDRLIPKVESLFPSLKGGRRIIGGYSLSALFALWCAYESDSFDGIAAASPSVWYPGWMEFVRSHNPKAHNVYLSLGDKEYKSRNRTLATVETCIRDYSEILSATEGMKTTLEWNPGNHFVDADLRTARAFMWTLNSISSD
ncbi:MAG: esterase [Bacteroidales bacterium]|nr:esterase [Bacteroidales bacterium]